MLKQPPLQTATATIENYCARLQSATLLEDRRAAIEGLRSVAKQYPASVASGSLRELILTLKRDGLGETSKRRDGEPRRSEEGGDVDTIRLVLETLLRLFEPDPDSPEAGDEIAFFIADEFCMRQENVALLLNLLDPTAPYSDNLSCKLSVQILSAICAARPERLQESILGAPLGVSRLVGVLDNSRDDVRYAGLELLTNLTGGANEELRKIVAFEDVFARVFALIALEGGLAEARIVVQDCLTLLINLVKGSASNQAMFRESGCIGQLVEVLRDVFPPAEPEAPFITENRVRGGWGLLQLLRQLLVPGEPSTPQNQHAFSRAGMAQILVDLAFTDIPAMVRATALWAVADLIRNNAPIQVNFASTLVHPQQTKQESIKQLQVNGTKHTAASPRNGARSSTEKQPTPVIEALLSLTLQEQRAPHELRVAGCAVIQAYLVGHLEIRAHFLQRAIAGHKEREEAPNVLSSLLTSNVDSTSVVLSGWTVQDLVNQNREAKAAFAAVQEGEASEGEDILTSISTLGSQLQQSIQQKAETTLIAAYATTLCVLLWDFADGINDFLAEGSSTLQTLVETVKSDTAVISGLTAALLGIIYEFSTKDSPIPRKTLATLLTQKLGRDRYLTALSDLRTDPAIRDYDLPLDASDRLELSESFFNLFLNEYARLRRAIDKDPGIEVIPYAAAEAGVQRDILDELRNQINSLETSLSQSQQAAAESSQQAQQDKLQSEQRLVALQKDFEQEKISLQKSLKTANAETERIRSVISKMQASHDEEVRDFKHRRQREKEENNLKQARDLAALRQEADRKAQQAKQSAEQGFAPVRQDFERRLAELGNAHRTEQSGHTTARAQLEAVTARHTQAEGRVTELTQQHQELSKKHAELQKSSQQLDSRVSKAEADLEAARRSIADNDAIVDNLKSQITDLTEETKGKDRELETERSGFADLEKELEAERSKKADAEEELKTVSSAKTDVEKELDSLRTEISTLKKELETSKADAAKSTTNAKGSKKDTDAAKKADKLKQLSDGLAEEVKKLKAAAEEAKQRETGHEKELQTHKKSLEEAQEAEKSAKEELENLLLVMGEIESKRDEYRAKVKELGGEVSEDEEEDSDEDEDEANDDVD